MSVGSGPCGLQDNGGWSLEEMESSFQARLLSGREGRWDRISPLKQSRASLDKNKLMSISGHTVEKHGRGVFYFRDPLGSQWSTGITGIHWDHSDSLGSQWSGLHSVQAAAGFIFDHWRLIRQSLSYMFVWKVKKKCIQDVLPRTSDKYLVHRE